MSPDPVWEEKAQWWRDNFANDNDAEYVEQILPLIEENLRGAQRVLDLGTGEGQVARRAAATGAFVVGIDAATAMINEAELRGGAYFLQGNVLALPFVDESFDVVTMSLVMEHVTEMSLSVAEIVRVLPVGGRLFMLLNHPLLQSPNSGWIVDHILEEQYWRIGPYLVENTTIEEVEEGVKIPFTHRPLSTYVNTMADAGLLVTKMIEPAPPAAFMAEAEEYAGASSVPRLLFLVAEKVR